MFEFADVFSGGIETSVFVWGSLVMLAAFVTGVLYVTGNPVIMSRVSFGPVS